MANVVSMRKTTSLTDTKCQAGSTTKSTRRNLDPETTTTMRNAVKERAAGQPANKLEASKGKYY
jgi:hypothetical protein